MISVEKLLGVVSTEAIEDDVGNSDDESTALGIALDDKGNPLPAIDYRLELIRKSDGSYEWVED